MKLRQFLEGMYVVVGLVLAWCVPQITITLYRIAETLK